MRYRRVPSLFMPACLSAPARPGLLLPVQAASCPSRPAPACLLHTKSVFVTGYALCLFPTSCDFPRRCAHFLCLFVSVIVLQTAPSLLMPALARPGLLLPALHEVGVCHRLCPVSFPDFVCLSEAEAVPASCPVCVFPRPRPCPRRPPCVCPRPRTSTRAPAPQRTCSAGAGFPTPALPGKRA